MPRGGFASHCDAYSACVWLQAGILRRTTRQRDDCADASHEPATLLLMNHHVDSCACACSLKATRQNLVCSSASLALPSLRTSRISLDSCFELMRPAWMMCAHRWRPFGESCVMKTISGKMCVHRSQTCDDGFAMTVDQLERWKAATVRKWCGLEQPVPERLRQLGKP